MAERSPSKRFARAKLGSHMSIAGGMHLALERAARIDATALQVFVKSARQWKTGSLTESAVERFKRCLEGSGLRDSTLAHAAYLINLASPDGEIRNRSMRALDQELRRCDRLRIRYLVLHPGSHRGAGEEAGLTRIVDAIDRLLTRSDAPAVTLLLEITAGQGSQLGGRFEHMARILECSEAAARLGVCFDTCHALAAGHDFRDARSYRRTMASFDRWIGIERLKAFHLNDSKYGVGSRRDRHEHIGRGHVGLEAFRRILNDCRFRDVPMILETPKGPDLEDDKANMARLRGLLPKNRR